MANYEVMMPAIWILSGLTAWLWIVCRNDMVYDIGSGFVAVLMLFPAAVGGPFAWLAVAISEWDGPIK